MKNRWTTPRKGNKNTFKALRKDHKEHMHKDQERTVKNTRTKRGPILALALHKQLGVTKHLGEKLGSCNYLYLKRMPWIHNEHHEKTYKNLHNDQSCWHQWEGHKPEELRMDGGRGKGMGVSVVGFGAASCWRGF
jgi:hypothetical protein